MSRVGKTPVEIPDGVSVDIAGQVVTAKGKLGELSATLIDDVEIGQEGNLISVNIRNDSFAARKMWGTSRSIINNLVVGEASFAGFPNKRFAPGFPKSKSS